MNRAYDEDLFESTKMTFGEHLEELRRCLWKAVLGLAIGMGIGLYFANDVVCFMQIPLSSALEDFYIGRSLQKLIDVFGAESLIPPAELGRLQSGQVVLDAMLWEPRQASESLKSTEGTLELVTGPELTPQTRDATIKEYSDSPLKGLSHIFLWRKVEEDPRLSIKSLSAQETFLIWLKAGFVFGAVVSSPWVFFQIWNFVAAGLYPHERKYVYVFLPFSLTLFFAGAALAFFVVFKYVLAFFFWYNAQMAIEPDARISEWLSFVIFMPLGFGISFQLPLVMLFLERIGIFTIESYLGKWRIAVLVIAFLSMILSPGGDPYSMLAMFGSLTALFFLGILLCKYFKRSANPFAQPA
jgi:sec-independent protein translocase protein TatC